MFLIVGLDGATMDLVEPWVEQGYLPNLAALMRHGSSGRLMAPMPPVTFPSWTTFMTGVNPGRHGIFDFTRREQDSYSVRFVNSTFRKEPTIWRLLSEAGLRVCSLGIPGNYPPEAVNGYTLSGFDTPVTTRANASFASPPSFADDVARAGGFPFADFQEFSIGNGWHQRALESMRQAIDKKTRLATSLLRREKFDCLMLLFGESDTAAHHFWSLHDPESPRYDAALAKQLGNGVEATYRRLDKALGELLEEAQPSNVLIVSDHGFGGVGDIGIRLNRWLRAEGFLNFKQRSPTSRWAGAMRSAAVRTIPERLQAPLFRLGGGRLAGAVESGVRFGGIDWSSTRVFSEELNYNPALWLNVEGREPNGVVKSEQYDALCREVSDRILDWRDPFSDAPVVRRVWRRDELYTGDYVHYAPDLILELGTPSGYSYMSLPSGGVEGPSIERLEGHDLRGGKLVGMSGSHRRDGIFILSGDHVSAGRYRGAIMADMTPTILALLQVATGQTFDGRVLDCITKADSVADRCETPLKSEEERYYDQAQERDLKERLERLGYL